MTLYGIQKYGTFKYGASILTRPRFALEVDWDNDGSFDGSNEAAAAGLTTGDGLVSFTVERGRQYTIAPNGDGFEQEDTGSLSTGFIDQGGRYDPYNSSSPLYGNLAGGKLCRMRVRTLTDQIYHLFSGVIKTPVSSQEGENLQTARLEAEDGWSYLRDQRNLVTIALQEAIYADEAMALILADAGWPSLWGSTLEAGVDLREYWWVDQRSPAAAIHELAQTELGRVCMAADGKLRFRSQTNAETPILTLTGDDIRMGGIRKLTPDEIVRNIIRVKSSKPSLYSTATVWQQADRLLVQPGETETLWADFGYNNTSVPVKSPITPVATTDYTAFANQDGSGTNLTANFTVTMTAYSTKGYLSIMNNGASAGWILIKVRGDPIVASNATTFEGRSTSSIAQYGARTFELEIQQDVNTARQYRDVLKAMLSTPRNYLRLELLPNPEVQFAVDLGEKVIVDLPDKGINETFNLIYVRHQSRNSLLSEIGTTWVLEPDNRVLTGVQVPFQVPFYVGTV